MTFKGQKKHLNQIQNAEKIRLFLDYDGTLADFAPNPDEIYLDPALIDLLDQLSKNPRLNISIISGRRLGHIRKLIPVNGILLGGTYGIELITPSGVQINRVEFSQIRPTLEEIKLLWSDLIKPHTEIYLEDKRWSLALHAKNIGGTLAEEILDQAKKIISTTLHSKNKFRILGGHKFLEVAPIEANKGRTIDYLLSSYPLAGELPVYIGDDDKDEEAFDVILKNKGIAIKVCSQPCNTLAQFRFKSPTSVRKFLKSFV